MIVIEGIKLEKSEFLAKIVGYFVCVEKDENEKYKKFV